MKLKVLLVLLLMGMLTLAFNFKLVKANSQLTATTRLSISPESIMGPPPNIGESFTVDIYIENVVNLTGWQVGLAWNASVLNCTNWTTLFGTSTFLGPSSDWLGFAGTINNTAGEVYPPYAYSLWPGRNPKSGNGTLVEVEFRVLDCGLTWINLTNVMVESNRVAIPVDLTNGTFELFPVHDVAVTSVTLSATEAYPTGVNPLYINATVKNNGTEMETFNVTVYYNSTLIATQTVTSLAPGAETTLTFQWQPYLLGYPDNPSAAWPYPIFIISTNASFVPGEMNTTNNHLSDGAVTMMWPGDAIGDGHINLRDLGLLASYWFSIPSYHQLVDFNMDGDIDPLDLAILEDNWFKGPLDARAIS